MNLKRINWSASLAWAYLSVTLSIAKGLGQRGVTPPDASPLRLVQHDICFNLDERRVQRCSGSAVWV